MAVELVLQLLTGESFALRTANIQDNARLDTKDQDFGDHTVRGVRSLTLMLPQTVRPQQLPAKEDTSWRSEKYMKGG